MANLAAFLMSLSWPLVKKVFLMLGIGIVTYEGLSALASQVQGAVLANFAGMPVAMLQLLTISGFAEAVGITLGALTARVALVAAGHIGRIAS